MYKVYGDVYSGNCYKIKLLLSLLDMEHEWLHVNILEGETHTPEFEKMNPNARIPVLDLGNGLYLSESNAILNFLAEGTDFLPADPYNRAKVLQWQFFEQYSHEPFIATARYIKKYLGLPKDREAEYYGKQQGGHKALDIMDRQLAATTWLAGSQLTIADISLYAYTHVAEEGGFDVSGYESIGRWIGAMQRQSDYVGMS
ncbi:MAG: glutathione S-transferase family protein [Gammaproteobacteria bacterium]|nr:glutathione S-transferase family protein [Gammaproteobacteria bacterium]